MFTINIKKISSILLVTTLFIECFSFGTHQAFAAPSDGTPDTDFNTNLGVGFTTGIVYELIAQSDGKILAGGSFTDLDGNTRNRLVRLNADGTEDTDFYTNLGTGFNDDIYTIALQSDGKILVGGQFTTFNGDTRNRLVRLNADGTEDTDFYTNLGTGFNDDIYTIALQANGKILVGGQFTTFNGNTRNRFVRLNADGTEDTDFYTNLGSGFGTSSVRTSVVQSDGKILVGGQFTTFNGNTRNRFVRLNADGTEDTDFYTNLGSGFDSLRIVSIALQSDGKILAGGIFTSFNGNTRNRLVRLNADGTEDADFYTNLGSGFNTSDVSGLAVQSDEKILVAGGFTALDGNTRNRFVRLNADGTEDTDFYANLGTSFNSFTLSVLVQSDGAILVGGAYAQFNGGDPRRLIRLEALTQPIFDEAQTNVDGDEITLTYDLALDEASVPATGDFVVEIDDVAATVNTVTVSGTTVVLAIDPDVLNGEVVEVSYTPGVSPLQGTLGKNVVTLASEVVTNNVPVVESSRKKSSKRRGVFVPVGVPVDNFPEQAQAPLEEYEQQMRVLFVKLIELLQARLAELLAE